MSKVTQSQQLDRFYRMFNHQVHVGKMAPVSLECLLVMFSTVSVYETYVSFQTPSFLILTLK